MRFLSTFEISGRSCPFEFSTYESQVLGWLKEPFPGTFLPRRFTQSILVSRVELLAGLDQFLRRMESEGDRLAYHYSIATTGRAGGEFAGSGGFSCKFKGNRAVAESGPGYCRIRAVGEAGPVPGLAVRNVILADLRDMQPITTDDGVKLTPKRTSRPLELEARARDLAIFLHCQDGEQVETRISRVG